MIKDPEGLKKFEERFISGHKGLTYKQSLKLFTSMWTEGVRLGVLPPKDTLEGIEIDEKIARVLNSCLKS